jgi:hypothetical protein
MNETWSAKADRLADALSHETSGGKLLRIERVAREQGVSPQTVHHLLRARSFIERLRADDPEIAKRMTILPYQALIALERWHARDREQMLSYLEGNPEPSVRQLTAAEKLSRVGPSIGMPAEHAIDVIRSAGGPVSPGRVLSRMMTWARMGHFDLEAVNWERETAEYTRAIGIDFYAVTPGKGRAALLVGPASQTTGHYGRHAKSVWYNAVCATTLFPLVIMLLPSKAAQSACLTSMPLPPNSDHDWPDWNSKVAPRGRPRSGPIRPASPTGGIVMFTTPEGICEDWRS